MIQVNLSRKRKRNVGREKKEENGRWDGMKEGMEGRRTCRRAKKKEGRKEGIALLSVGNELSG